MNKHFLHSAILTVALSALAGTASAGQLTWDFASLFTNAQQNTSLGATTTFSQGTDTLRATAVVASPLWTASTCADTPTEPCLFAKVTSPPESGLGLIPNGEEEIYSGAGIALQSSTPVVSIELGSIQSSESWAVAGCSATFGGCKTLDWGVGGGNANGLLTLSGLGSFASYVVFVPCANNSSCGDTTTNNSNNILLMSVTTSVPEPGTLALFGAGLLGCAFFVSRRRRSSQSQA